MAGKKSVAPRPRKDSAPGKRNTAEAILEAAERLCATRGIEAMSIRDVAAAVGVTLPVIYHHFGSRANLIRALVIHRFSEVGAEYGQLVSMLETQKSPAVRDILRAALQPVNQWRRPGREFSLRFYALALVSPSPEVRDTLDIGVRGYHPIVALLERALPHLTHEDICWRLYFTLKLSHQNERDTSRLSVLSKGKCSGADPEEVLERTIDFAEAAFLAPPSGSSKSKTVNSARAKDRRRQK
jgi:AcrR family transcriptional regulator